MGVESAVYRFIPLSKNSDAPVAALVAAVAERRDENHLVVRSQDFWIDFEIDVPIPSVGLRVSFTNPASVVEEIRRILSVLESSGAGDLLDPVRKLRFTIDDEQKVDELLDLFFERRKEFQRYFGPFEAAVSADAVFRLMRERSSG